MDKLLQNPNVDTEQQAWTDPGSISDLVEQVIGFARRQFPIIAFIFAAALALGSVYLFTTPSLFTANALLVIDTSKMRVLQQQQATIGELPLDTTQVETQVELLKSEGIGLSVVKDLKLTEDPEFVSPRAGFIGSLWSFVAQPFLPGVTTPQPTASEYQLTRRALGYLQGNRQVRRVARTYVIDISFTSLNRGRAAAVANGIAEAYILDQLESKYQAQRRASKWLQERIAELRLQALAADRAVLEFREQKSIVGMGGSDSRLLGEQQVVDINAQLGQARAAKAEMGARLERIQEVMKQDVPDATVADSLRNEIINRLRAQYLDYDRRHHLWSSRYGEAHLAAVNLKTQMVQLRRSMHDELGRIAESYKSDYEIAKAREEELERSLSQLISGTQLTNRDRLGLKELESSARVYHSIHDNFLQRYMEMTQQLSFPITEARVISSASPPGGASSPQMLKVLAIAGALGLMLGVGVAVLREAVDRVFRTSRQIETTLKTNCLAVLPALKGVVGAGSGSQAKRTVASAVAGISRRLDQNIPSIYRYVIHEPLSSFAEGFRAIKVAADISGAIKENKVIGVTSSLPHEGKSTAATNLAELIAHGGNKVILVDADLRNPTLSRNLVSKPAAGLLEVIGRKVTLENAVYTDEQTGLVFLPAVIESHLAHSSEILGSEAFKQLVDGLRKIYDYVVIDLPPLAPVVDVRATTRVIDSYVFVVEWGQTRINMVQRQLGMAPEVFERLLGVVLNKANMKVLDRYENYYGRYYYKRYYARYGYTQ